MAYSEDICVNLAHVHYAQSRFLEAEHQYQATLRTAAADRHSHADKMSALCEYSAMAQFSGKRCDESVRSLLRALHYDPMCLRLWFNVAIVRADTATQIMQKSRRTVADIEVASVQLSLAHRLFLFLGSTPLSQAARGAVYDKDQAVRHSRLCEVRLSLVLRD